MRRKKDESAVREHAWEEWGHCRGRFAGDKEDGLQGLPRTEIIPPNPDGSAHSRGALAHSPEGLGTVVQRAVSHLPHL